MPLEAILVLAILVGAVALFISEKFPIDFVALLVLGVLLLFGLRGFRRPAPPPWSGSSWSASARATSRPWS